MGTGLQARGLPPHTSSDAWNLSHPQDVAAVHEQFVAAGAAVVCSNTLCSLPGSGSDWEERLRAGVSLAQQAGVAVWLSLGPGEGHARAVAAVRDDVDAVLLETFAEPAAGLEALEAVVGFGVPVVLSFVPGGTGAPRDGRGWAELVESVAARGGAGIGVNCMPADVVGMAVGAMGTRMPILARPSGASARDLRALSGRVRWLGGCCGTGPAAIAGMLGRDGDLRA